MVLKGCGDTLSVLSSLVYLCLCKVFKDAPPIYHITSPKVSFVGEVFSQGAASLGRNFLSFMRTSQAGSPRGIQVVDLDSAQLRLCQFITTFHVKSHYVETIKVGRQNYQINQRTVKEEQERSNFWCAEIWRQLGILKSWEAATSESVTTAEKVKKWKCHNVRTGWWQIDWDNKSGSTKADWISKLMFTITLHSWIASLQNHVQRHKITCKTLSHQSVRTNPLGSSCQMSSPPVQTAVWHKIDYYSSHFYRSALYILCCIVFLHYCI